MGEASWDQTIDEWVVAPGTCYAAGLAQNTDHAFYAAAPVAGEAGWGFIYAEDHEEDVLQDDGETTKKFKVNEATQLKATLETGRAPYGGLWLGGKKYNVTRSAVENLNDVDYSTLFVQCPKGGCHIAKTPGDNSQIVAGFYSEEKGQQPPNARTTVLAFAEYLHSIGY